LRSCPAILPSLLAAAVFTPLKAGTVVLGFEGFACAVPQQQCPTERGVCMRFKAVLLFTVLAVMCSFTLNAQMAPMNHAQPAMTMPTSSDATQLPVLADGSVHPELIPDDVAYRQFLQGMAFPANLSAAQVAHRNAKLKRLKLTQADSDLLVNVVLAGLRETLDAATVLLHTALTPDDAATAKANRLNALTAAQANLSKLSTAGQTAVDAWVKGEFKKRIIIYGGPMM